MISSDALSDFPPHAHFLYLSTFEKPFVVVLNRTLTRAKGAWFPCPLGMH